MANPQDSQSEGLPISETNMSHHQWILYYWGGGERPQSEGHTEQPGERSIPRINRECVYS
jgi:hypothetical protein